MMTVIQYENQKSLSHGDKSLYWPWLWLTDTLWYISFSTVSKTLLCNQWRKNVNKCSQASNTHVICEVLQAACSKWQHTFWSTVSGNNSSDIQQIYSKLIWIKSTTSRHLFCFMCHWPVNWICRLDKYRGVSAYGPVISSAFWAQAGPLGHMPMVTF